MKTSICLIFIFLVFCNLANISGQNKPITFGIKAGVNFSNSSTTIDTNSHELNEKGNKTGFLLGMTVDFKISEVVYFQSGLSYTTKGVIFKAKNSFVNGIDPNKKVDKELNLNLSYLQLPMMLAYKAKLSSTTRLVIAAGPYLAYGIGGKMKFDAIFSSAPSGYVSKDDDLNSFGERTFKRFDFGLGTSIGLEYKNYCLNFNYEWGVSNCNRDAYNSDIVILFHKEYKNRNASLALGYKF